MDFGGGYAEVSWQKIRIESGLTVCFLVGAGLGGPNGNSS